MDEFKHIYDMISNYVTSVTFLKVFSGVLAIGGIGGVAETYYNIKMLQKLKKEEKGLEEKISNN